MGREEGRDTRSLHKVWDRLSDFRVLALVASANGSFVTQPARVWIRASCFYNTKF